MRSLAVFALLAAATIGSASASMVVYSTAGSNFTGTGFSSGSGTDTVVVMGPMASDAVLIFIGPGPGPAPVTINTPTDPTNISYGFIQETYISSSGSTINVPAFTFNLIINNLTSGTAATFVGTAAASTVTAVSSSLSIAFPSQPLTDGNATFFINSPTSMVAPLLISLDGSVSTGTTNAIPEPGSMFLLGAGLIGLGLAARGKFTGRR